MRNALIDLGLLVLLLAFIAVVYGSLRVLLYGSLS